MKPSHSSQPDPFLVIVAAWVIPGLGHYLLGEKQRAYILCITLYALFATGLLIGGIDVINRPEGTITYMGQILIGPPAPALALLGQALAPAGAPFPAPPTTAREPLYTLSIGHIHNIGALYCAFAGGLNLLAILDAFGRSSPPP